LQGRLGPPGWGIWFREKERGRFFGRRNEIMGFAGLIAMLLAGFFLDRFKMISLTVGFATIFLHSDVQGSDYCHKMAC
jgi:hypothetical protein